MIFNGLLINYLFSEFVADNLKNKVQIEIDEELKDEIDDIRNEWLQVNLIICISFYYN